MQLLFLINNLNKSRCVCNEMLPSECNLIGNLIAFVVVREVPFNLHGQGCVCVYFLQLFYHGHSFRFVELT